VYEKPKTKGVIGIANLIQIICSEAAPVIYDVLIAQNALVWQKEFYKWLDETLK
jgi:hypothetical protein